jgi:hypothetical protein
MPRPPLKKKLNRWQAERETLNHKDFQHYFYDLIARPRVVNALDSFSSGQCEALPERVVSVLSRWSRLKEDFQALFLRANPEAVASCELSLALLTPHDPSSVALIEKYKGAYGDAINAKIKAAGDSLEKVDQVVNALLGQGAGGGWPASAAHALGTELSARCKAFSTHVSSLRSLADLSIEGDE